MDLEEFCGMEKYGTSTEGVDGEIKTKPEDFRVEEIPVEKKAGGEFLLCELKKKNLTTFQAISKIASALNISEKRIGFAGIKDRRAVTTQRISIKGVDRGNINGLDIENVELTPVESSSKPVKPGQLSGNKFEATIRNIELSQRECQKRLEDVRKEVGNDGIPNYFGLQRFGRRRPVSHLVGRKLLKRKFEDSIMIYLTKTFPTENGEFREARERFQEEGNFSEALDYFPQALTYERKLLKKISGEEPSRKGEWMKCLKVFPKNLRRLFVHAYQSYVFNSSLSELLEGGKVENFPAKIVGYSTRLSDSKFDQKIKEKLEEDSIKPDDFRFREPSELSSEGDVRAAMIRTDIDIEEISEDEINPGSRKVTVSFSLKPGRYATVVIRELRKTT